MEFDDKSKMETPIYDELFDILSNRKIDYPFKLSISMFGHLYISWSSISRTVSFQPTFLTLLCYGLKTVDDTVDIEKLGGMVGTHIQRNLNKISIQEGEIVRKTIAHNLIMLRKSYGLDRHKETYCIRAIARKIMTKPEYDRLVTEY